MGSSRAVFLLCCVLLSWWFCLSLAADQVKVKVKGVTSIAKTDDNFICATLDWWPEDKCDYNECPWGKSGLFNLVQFFIYLAITFDGLSKKRNFHNPISDGFILPLQDLKNKIRANAMKAFNSLRIRIGGSLEDQLVYKVGTSIKKCPHFKKLQDGLFGFSRGCLPMERWDELNALFNKTGVLVTFSLNALIGRKKPEGDDNDILWVGDWNAQNARDFMTYTVSKGYKIDSWELGNELCGTGVAQRVEAEPYGKDMIGLKQLVKELYPDPSTQPKVLGPGGFYDEKWFREFLQTSGAGVVDGLTHHIYNLGAGVDKTLINKIQDPYFLDQVAQTYKDISRSVDLFGPWSGAWVGESGGAFNSGGKDVSHTFVDGFWYLDQLGMTSTFNHKVFCRQTLIGGNYALLNTTTFIPNPDYYGALLWRRLMGKDVLSTTHEGSPYLRVYSHCSKNSSGIAVLIINMSNSTSFEVSIVNDYNLSENSEDGQQREEYHLTPKNGNIQSDVLLLNGTPLELTESSDIPVLNPQLVDASKPITVAPDSIVFANLRGFKAPACA